MSIKRLALLLACTCWLTACSASSAGVTFDQDYHTFHFKGKDYAITATPVGEDSIRQTKAQFMTFALVQEKTERKESISLNNLYETETGELALGIQDGYYLVKEEEQVGSTDRIDFHKLPAYDTNYIDQTE